MTQRGVNVPVLGAAAANGEALAVDVENRYGAVLLEVDPTLAAPVVDFESEGTTSRNPAWVAAQIETTTLHPILRVLATPDAGGRDLTLRVRVPSCAGVRVRTTGGGAVVHGARGAVDVQAGDAVTPGGTVDVEFGEKIDAPVVLSSSTGNVSMNAPLGSTGHLRVRCPTPPAMDGQRQGIRVVSTLDADWQGTLGPGGYEVLLTAPKGRVTITLRR